MHGSEVVMKQVVILGSLSALALGVSGCGALSSLPVVGGLFGGGEEAAPVDPQPVIPLPADGTGPSPAATAPTPAEGEAPAPEGEATEETAAPNRPPALAANGLIPSTDSGARLRTIQIGRQDPFSAVPVTPQIVAATTALGTGMPRALPPLPRTLPPLPRALPPLPRTRNLPKQPAARSAPTNNRSQPRASSPPSQPSSPPSSRPQPSEPIAPQPLPDFEPALPPLPEPDLARAVRVTGVVQVGNEVRAIVEPPDETSRYVRIGDYLANGQVLVKRIDLNAGPQPVVILEQFGIEVARPVGDRTGPGASQAAALPAGDRSAS